MSRPGPANYTANVNRAKTKKWVEAKSYSYDGDDWGEVDDYDEYGGYGEPEPEPATKPTGLRQRGQSATQVPQGAYRTQQDLYRSPVDARQPYGNPTTPAAQQQQQQQNNEGRNFTSHPARAQPGMIRTNSFDREDEQRTFSAGGPQRHDPHKEFSAPSPQGHNVPPQDFQATQPHYDYPIHSPQTTTRPPVSEPGRTSIEGQPRYGEPANANYRGPSYFDQPRQVNMGSRSQSMASNNSAMDFQNRREFSPTAIPPPLQTRGSPSPRRADVDPTSRPPRKSSLGQGGAPNQHFPPESPFVSVAPNPDEGSTANDQVENNSESARPFVRPAEIYRRMQEEKEKERQSQESIRPNVEAFLGPSSDRPALERSQDSEMSQRLKPVLDAVKERKSEYGIEGVNVPEPETTGERRTSSKTFEFPKRTPNSNLPAQGSSLGPILPDVSRVSGFGESLFSGTNMSSDDSKDQMSTLTESSVSQENPQTPRTQTETPGKDLQHQPSLGFTSAVHRAFDTAEEQVPPTPSSTQGSSIGRSTSAGTSTISPIISRGPSTAKENVSSRLPGIDSISTPMIPEGPEAGSPRPLSSDSLGTPTQISRKRSPSEQTQVPEKEAPPPSFIPGYRRSSDTPSPDNSPRRTPALETSRQLRQPQEVEFAAATPTDPGFSTDNSSLGSEPPVEEETRTDHPTSKDSDSDVPLDVQPTLPRPDGPSGSRFSPISPAREGFQNRTDSSSSNRVRNLADKFESNSRPSSAHSTTPRASMLSEAQKKDDLAPTRPFADRMESFRPQLPGGWQSSASIAPIANSNTPRAPGVPPQPNDYKPTNVSAQKTSTTKSAQDNDNSASLSDQYPSSVTQIKDASEEAFAAVAAAGSALAGAFGVTIGTQGEAPLKSTSPDSHGTREEYGNDKPQSRRDSALQSETHLQHAIDPGAERDEPEPLPNDVAEDSNTSSAERDYPDSSSRSWDREYARDHGDSSKPDRHSQSLPMISTDTRPQQYESDRLRKEIVRELTPMSASEPTTAETDDSNYPQTLSTNPSLNRPGHESGVLPREYESYWNDAASDEDAEDLDRAPGHGADATIAERQENAATMIQPLQPNPSPVMAPQEKTLRERSPMLPHRFSWEQPLQQLPSEAERSPGHQVAPSSDFLDKSVYSDGRFQSQDEQNEIANMARSTTQDQAEKEPPSVPEKDLPDLESSQLPEVEMRDPEIEEMSIPSGLEPARLPAEQQTSGLSQRDAPLESIHLSQSPELQPRTPVQLGSNAPAQAQSIASVPQHTDTQAKILTFREILAFQSPHDRIRAYNETREQFSRMDTGLTSWLGSTFNHLPEHGDLLAGAGRAPLNLQSHRPSPSRSKLGSFIPSSNQANQQLSAGSNGNTSFGGTTGGSAQAYQASGGSGGKLSSQQVQAKGKDLLHSAGVFGGKANVAAKGLFSKGKSKLRAASGNEKASLRKDTNLDKPPSKSYQQPPESQVHSSSRSSNDVQGGPVRARARELQAMSESPQPTSPGETPSVESFTPSQLGDDERSEEDPPPRAFNRGSRQKSVSMQKHADESVSPLPFRPEAAPAKQSPIYSKEAQTPQSATSSNKTPTQATFKDSSPPTTPSKSRGVENVIAKRNAQVETSTFDNIDEHSGKKFPRGLETSPQVSPNLDSHATPTIDPDDTEPGSLGSETPADMQSTIRKVADDKHQGFLPDSLSESQSPQTADLDRMSRAPTRLSALAQSEISQTSEAVRSRREGQPKSRPVSLKRDSLRIPRPSEDHSVRSPSIDGLPSHLDLNRPPFLSPHLTMDRETAEQGRRNGPIHYGLDHDFVPDADYDATNPSRSQSTACQSQGPQRRNGYDRPLNGDGDDILQQSHAGQYSHGQSPILRQQAPEYQSEGMGSPIEWPSQSKPRSRRGSRSSAFFESLALGSSSQVDEPSLPYPEDAQSDPSQNILHTPIEKRKSKRTSVLRSLKRNSGSASTSTHSKENVVPKPSIPLSPQTLPNSRSLMPPNPILQPPPPPPEAEDDEFPSRGNSRSASSRFSKRLQRSSTSGKTEQYASKKNRFSAIGSLFGRGSPKKHNSLSQVDRPPRIDANPTQTPQQHIAPNNPRSSQHEDWYTPPKNNYTAPPPGGYYAPRPAQAHEVRLTLNPPIQDHNRTFSRTSDSSAYVQDAAIRQRPYQSSSPPAQMQNIAPRSSATFPHTNHQQSYFSVPRSSTTHNGSREHGPKPISLDNKGSGSAWTRFSQHGRSKSRQDPSRPPSNTAPSAPHEEPNRSSLRSNSPPPPPPPPKDEWHRPSIHGRSVSAATSGSSKHTQSPSQASGRPVSGQPRQSLPPLQTNVSSKRGSAIGLGKTMTPEEKRKSRQKEIEYSTLRPGSRRVEDEEDEPIVMSATSFPGQEWQPDYAHWDGD